MDKSWLDSILNAGTTAYGNYQQQQATAAAQKLAAQQAKPTPLPTWLIPAGIGVFALLVVGFIFTRGR